MKTFIQSQFNYCPLLWMCHNRQFNTKINKLHERSLRIVYKKQDSTFQELLDLDNSVTVHQRNLQKLATEMYKVKTGIAPLIMNDVFEVSDSHYNLRFKAWATHNVRTVNNGTETLSFRGPKTWEILPDSIKYVKSLTEFKMKIKTWEPVGCTCRLCQTYIPSLGFI